MKKLLFISLVILAAFARTGAQSMTDLPADHGEQLYITADRSIYSADEKIHYVVEYSPPAGFEYLGWSKVIYVELIRWDGKKIAGSKVPVRSNLATGFLKVPHLTLSGHYYLRAYTLWMRNYGPDRYPSLSLMILNPYHREVVSGPEDTGEDQNLNKASARPGENDQVFRVEGLDSSYAPGENVEFAISVGEEMQGQKVHLAVSRTPMPASGSMPSGSMSSGTSGNQPSDPGNQSSAPGANDDSPFIFMPETGGLSLTGHVRDASTGRGVEGAQLQLSSYATPFFYSEEQTNADGSFFFSLPHQDGDQPEFHITKSCDRDYDILLAPEFCSKKVLLPYLPLELDSAELVLASEIMVNAQLAGSYEPPEALLPEFDEHEKFYGSQATIVRVSDYIELGDLREVIYEIIPQVLVRNENGSPRMFIQGPGCQDFYPPLVLVDNVPVPNDEALLRLPSNRIESIEVLNRGYIIGESVYSGIFSIRSKNQDMAGLDKDRDQHFFNFSLLDHPEPAMSHDDSPDVRNCLLWKPGLDFSETGMKEFNFKTPLLPGHYVVSILGRDADGELRIFTQNLEVRR